MSRTREEKYTYEEGLNEFFGGIKGLSKQSFPFTCRCGENTYPKKDPEGVKLHSILSVNDCIKHMRKIHMVRFKR